MLKDLGQTRYVPWDLYFLNKVDNEDNKVEKNNKEEVSLNRNEYGEFSSGLSGSASNSISIKDGKVNEYSIEANGAYNYYGEEHGSSSDYLISTSCKYSKDENNNRKWKKFCN